MFFGGVLIVGGWGVVGCCRKSYLGPAEIASFSSGDISQSIKHDTFWHFVSTGYFYILFLWCIAITDFCPLENYENFGLPLSTITFTVNNHAENNFYKYISFKYYTVWSQIFIKIHVKVFYIQIWFKCKTPLLFFLIRTMIYRKKTLYREK